MAAQEHVWPAQPSEQPLSWMQVLSYSPQALLLLEMLCWSDYVEFWTQNRLCS